jgi:4-amino-4-deoxy-L-arabinose transferase-like glycosyltransferase
MAPSILQNKFIFFKYKKITTTIILVLLVCIGAFLRLYRLEWRTGWGYDTARDIFAGQTISFNNVPSVGHYAEGNNFYYPPYYYLLIKAVSLINPDPVFVIGVFVVYESLIVLAVYYFGYTLFSNATGLLSAMFCALTASIIDKGSNFVGYYVVVPATVFSITLIIKGFRFPCWQRQLIGFLLLLFLSTIDYSVLYVIIYMMVVRLFVWGFKKTIYFAIALFTGFLLLNLPLIKYFGLSDFISHFSPLTQANFHPNIISNFIGIWQKIWFDLFSYQKTSQCVAIVLVVMILIVNLIFNRKRQKIIILCLGMMFMVLMGSIKKGNIYLHHYVLIEPVLLIIFSELLVFIWNRFSKAALRTTVTFTALLLFFYLIHNCYPTTTVRNEIYKSMFVAKYIEYLAINKSIKQFTVYATDVYSGGWQNLGVIFFLNKDNLVKVKYVNYENNIEQIIDPNAPIFVVCMFYKEDQNKCLNRFWERHPKHHFGYKIFIPISNYELYFYSTSRTL